MSVTLEALSKDWLRLSSEYRPSAFWFWNSEMDEVRMREVISGLAENSVREFLIHPVHGMEIEYLSGEFFDRYRYALGLAREHDLKVWVYDEYAWPSGTARRLSAARTSRTPGVVSELRKKARRRGDCRTRAIGPGPRQQRRRTMDRERARLCRYAEHGRCALLHRQMHRRAIYKECGDFFGGTIVGFFTDEPSAMIDAPAGRSMWQAAGMPWTPSLPQRFRDRFGYEIEPRYAELAGDGPAAVKRDYWALVKEMHSESYHGQIGEWCREHGVKYTGHVGEDVPLMQVRFAGSAFECLKHMDEPGVDMLA